MPTTRGKQALLTRRAAHATWWSAIEIAARYGVQFVVMVLLARMLVPADFGLIAMLLVFTSIAGLLVNAGFGTALVQKQHTTADDEATVFWTSITISFVVAVGLWFAAPAIADFYSQPILSPLTHLMLFVLPLSALAAVPDALLTQRLDFRSRAKAEVFASVCSAIVALSLAFLGFGVWSLAWQAIVAMGVRAGLLWIYCQWRPRGRFCRGSFRQLFSFGGYMLLADLLNVISIRMQSLLIGRFFQAQELGYYTLAQNTQLAPAQFMGSVLNRVGLPVFSSIADQPKKLASALRMTLRVALFVFLPCMVGLAVVAKPLVVFVYGSQWLPAAPLLSILALAAMLWPLHSLNLAALAACGRSDLSFRIEVAKRIVSISLIVAASFYSVTMVALAVLVSSLVAVLINTWYSHKLLDYGLLAQLRDQSATIVLSGLAACTAWLVVHLIHDAPMALGSAILSAICVYVLAAMLGKVTAWTELVALLHALRSNHKIHMKASDENT